MKKINCFILSCLFVQTVFAGESQCILEDAFVFGASLSAGYTGMGDIFAGKGSGLTPLDVLIEQTGKTFTYDSENSRVKGGWYFNDTRELLEGDSTLEKMKSSTLLMSLDAFYWDSIDGEAHRKYNSEPKSCEQSIQMMKDVVSFAKENEKALILANIPSERGTPVSPLIRVISNWRDPYKDCYLEFNQTLGNECLVENNCFIIDINSVVEQLNSGNGILWQKRVYYREELRMSDGLHLTTVGSEYIASLIRETINESNPSLLQCF